MSLSCRTRSLFVAVLLAGACSNSTSPKGPPAELKELPRALTGSEQKVIAASNAFSFALWNRLNAAQPDTNIFISPLSASFALGMALNGAANQTAAEMRATLAFGGAPQQEINDGYKSLIALLMSLDPGVAMQIANSIWYRNDFPFNASFLDGSRTYFDAQAQGLNFNDAAGSLATINGWANTKTNGRIPTILSRVRPTDVMFLINAIYFKGSWRDKFELSATRDTLFHPAVGAAQPMRLMRHTGDMKYANMSAYQAAEIPYGNTAFAMTVILPSPGVSVDSVAASFTLASWQVLTTSLHSSKVDLALPKLQIEYGREFNDDLKAMGMVVPFTPGAADFTPMSPLGASLYISFVKQKTFAKVDEEGTEAAAVTAVGIGVTSSPPGPQVVRVDRPYIFVLRERLSGTILFMGKIVRMP